MATDLVFLAVLHPDADEELRSDIGKLIRAFTLSDSNFALGLLAYSKTEKPADFHPINFNATLIENKTARQHDFLKICHDNSHLVIENDPHYVVNLMAFAGLAIDVECEDAVASSSAENDALAVSENDAVSVAAVAENNAVAVAAIDAGAVAANDAVAVADNDEY